jgi:hypothetical protein
VLLRQTTEFDPLPDKLKGILLTKVILFGERFSFLVLELVEDMALP